MPCMKNGMAVPGQKGSCPLDSTWVEDSFVPSVYEGEDDLPITNIGDYLSPGGVFKAGAGLAVAAPFLKGGASYVKKKVTDPKNLDKLKNLANKLFKQKVTPKRPQFPIMNKAQQAAWNKANPATFKLDPTKLTAYAAATGLTIQQLMERMQGPENTATGTSGNNFISPNAQRRETFDAGINPRTGEKLSSSKTGMQKMGDNLKNPDWWKESMSGLKGDTRLSRLGVLMDYYGRTPKQRAAVDMPAKVFAANEAAAQKNKVAALAAQAKANTTAELYGKKTLKDLTAELLPDVKEMFGDTFLGGFSSNPNAGDADAMTAIAGEVATNIKAISLAFPNKTPGEVRMLALQQVMEDRGLEDLR